MENLCIYNNENVALYCLCDGHMGDNVTKKAIEIIGSIFISKFADKSVYSIFIIRLLL